MLVPFISEIFSAYVHLSSFPPSSAPHIHMHVCIHTYMYIMYTRTLYTHCQKYKLCETCESFFFFLNHLCFVRNNLPVFFGKVNVNLLQDLCECLHLDLHLGMQFNILLCGQDYGDPYFVKCLQYYFYNQGKN